MRERKEHAAATLPTPDLLPYFFNQSTLTLRARALLHTPLHSYTTQPPSDTPSSPNPFGFRRFKGHKHDREAAARRAATVTALLSMPQKIAEHRAARRAIVSGASAIDQLLSRPKELRLKAGRGAVPGPPKK